MEDAVILDADQVLFDYYYGFARWYEKKYGISLLGYPETWGMEEWVGVTSSELYPLVMEFAESDEFRKLPATAGSKFIVDAFRDEGFTLICVTSCGTTNSIRYARIFNLLNEFGNVFKEIHILDANESKYDTLRDIHQRYNVIGFMDDKEENLVDAQRVGIRNVIQIRAFKEMGNLIWLNGAIDLLCYSGRKFTQVLQTEEHLRD